MRGLLMIVAPILAISKSRFLVHSDETLGRVLAHHIPIEKGALENENANLVGCDINYRERYLKNHDLRQIGVIFLFHRTFSIEDYCGEYRANSFTPIRSI